VNPHGKQETLRIDNHVVAFATIYPLSAIETAGMNRL
jgi:hypothetical protein